MKTRTNTTSRALADLEARRRGWTFVPVPAASLSHLSQATLNWLYPAGEHVDPKEFPFLVAHHDNGVFMTLPAPHHRAGLPQDLLDVFAAADGVATHGWIMLDIDGDELADLPTYGRS